MSAGIAAESETQLSPELIAWADTIFVMEGRHRKSIEARFRAHIGNRKIVCLDIPDRYRFMEPALVDLLYQRVTPHLR